MVKLGVNIDHVATLREARGGEAPRLVLAAREAVKGGADGITVHLREDRRHIQDRDLWELKRSIRKSLNLEMSVVPEIVRIACRLRPEKACLVPERRQELTTEGGLDVAGKLKRVKDAVSKLSQRKIEVSLFIDPEIRQVRAAKRTGAPAVELHTGAYANASGAGRKRELARLERAALEAYCLGLRVHAGHGLDYENVKLVARLPYVKELNIGHSIVSRSVFVGMRRAVREMKAVIAGRGTR
jgi:pyridoxine 5-phosphate synthase